MTENRKNLCWYSIHPKTDILACSEMPGCAPSPDPSVREWPRPVIKADKKDHLGLTNHSLLMPESSPTPFVDSSRAS